MGLTWWSGGCPAALRVRAPRGDSRGATCLGRVVAGATVCVAWMQGSRAEGVVRVQLQPFTWVAFVRESRGQS